MKLSEIITKAQILSGAGLYDGNAVDESMMAACVSIFHDTLNDINNDDTISLVQKHLDYQACLALNCGRPIFPRLRALGTGCLDRSICLPSTTTR